MITEEVRKREMGKSGLKRSEATMSYNRMFICFSTLRSLE